MSAPVTDPAALLAAVVEHASSGRLAARIAADYRVIVPVEHSGYAIAYSAAGHGEDAYVLCLATGQVTTVLGYLPPAAMIALAVADGRHPADLSALPI